MAEACLRSWLQAGRGCRPAPILLCLPALTSKGILERFWECTLGKEQEKVT